MFEAVDFISGSYPCQGNSVSGSGLGMNDPRSCLVGDLMRLVSECNPKIVFVENVPPVLQNGSFDFMLEQLCKTMDYHVAWGVLSACDVGRPHLRERFFCVAVKNEPAAKDLLRECCTISEKATLHKVEQEPRRMLIPISRRERDNFFVRLSALGNAVVPDASKKAFETLGRLLLDGVTPPDEYRKTKFGKHSTWGLASCVSSDVCQRLKRPRFDEAAVAIELLPDSYTHKNYQKNPQTRELCEKPVTRTLWSTPRHGNYRACNILTRRSLTDLASQLRYEKNTPDADRAGITNPVFVEYLMGFPADFTLYVDPDEPEEGLPTSDSECE
jgi:site-specific DNA-cytosine methylase